MPIEYRVQVRGITGTAPETAALRLIANLPTQWVATLIECTGTTAVLSFKLPGNPSPIDVANVVDDALTHPGMLGWIRDGPVTSTRGLDEQEDPGAPGSVSLEP